MPNSSADVGVLFIHGMGAPEPTFADELRARIAAQLGGDAQRVAFGSCFWSDILQKQQDVTWGNVSKSNIGSPLVRKARRWVVNALGDPVSYLSGYLAGGKPAYQDVHDCVRDSLRSIEERLVDGHRPLIVFAHSLGGVVISNYIWNEQRRAGDVEPKVKKTSEAAPQAAVRQAQATTPFQSMETLTALVTYGCNIPLFLPPSPPIECIRFPSPRLPPELAKIARWTNVYDPDDLLGYPIANIWTETHGTVIHDVVMDVGPWYLSWTPLSHVYYDRSNEFVARAAGTIREAMRA